MRANKQLLLAVLMAVLSGVIVLGSLSLSFFESGYTLVQGQAGTPVSLIPGDMMVTLFAQQTAGGGNVGFETPLPPTGQVVGQILPPTPTIAGCSHPEGWQTITISLDDTLASLAHSYNTSMAMLKQANCLVIDHLVAGTELRVPALPAGQVAATRSTAAACSPPVNWVRYSVRYGDTLYNLGYRLGYSVYQLQSANCLSSNYIYTGQTLRLPYYPPALQATFTPWVPSPTWRVPTTPPVILPVPSSTSTSAPPPVWTATNTSVPTVVITEVPAPSDTPVTVEPLPSPTPVTPPPSPTDPPAPIPTNTEPAPVIISPSATSTPVPPLPPPPPPPVNIAPTATSVPVPPPTVPPAPTSSSGTYPFP